MNKTSRRQFLRQTTAASSALALGSAARGARADGPGPNVVYVFSDQHRHQSMSFTEMPELYMPNLARMAQEGTSFSNCVSNYPLCSPHRAILMTGLFPYQMAMRNESPGMIDNNLPLSPNQATLGKAFRDAGCATGYIGKWHLGGDTTAHEFGFDFSRIWENTNEHWDSYYFDDDGVNSANVTEYNATAMTDQALQYIQDHQAERFFLMLSLNPPHGHFDDARPDMLARYPDPETSLSRRPNYEGRPSHLDADWERYQGYHAHISGVDAEIGRIMARLDALGLSENTILVYSADHGSMMFSQGLRGKRYPYEESVRVPFLVRWPGTVPANAVRETLLGTIDTMPTLCALAGVPVPSQCVGQNLSKSVLGQPGPEPQSQFIMHIRNDVTANADRWFPYFRGVRTARHTFAYRGQGAWHDAGNWLLFDNLADPYQQSNLLAAPEEDQIPAMLEQMLTEWLETAQDPFPFGPPDPPKPVPAAGAALTASALAAAAGCSLYRKGTQPKPRS